MTGTAQKENLMITYETSRTGSDTTRDVEPGAARKRPCEHVPRTLQARFIGCTMSQPDRLRLWMDTRTG